MKTLFYALSAAIAVELEEVGIAAIFRLYWNRVQVELAKVFVELPIGLGGVFAPTARLECRGFVIHDDERAIAVPVDQIDKSDKQPAADLEPDELFDIQNLARDGGERLKHPNRMTLSPWLDQLYLNIDRVLIAKVTNGDSALLNFRIQTLYPFYRQFFIYDRHLPSPWQTDSPSIY